MFNLSDNNKGAVILGEFKPKGKFRPDPLSYETSAEQRGLPYGEWRQMALSCATDRLERYGSMTERTPSSPPETLATYPVGLSYKYGGWH
jgi:hypothetical protein